MSRNWRSERIDDGRLEALIAKNPKAVCWEALVYRIYPGAVQTGDDSLEKAVMEIAKNAYSDYRPMEMRGTGYFIDATGLDERARSRIANTLSWLSGNLDGQGRDMFGSKERYRIFCQNISIIN